MVTLPLHILHSAFDNQLAKLCTGHTLHHLPAKPRDDCMHGGWVVVFGLCSGIGINDEHLSGCLGQATGRHFAYSALQVGLDSEG